MQLYSVVAVYLHWIIIQHIRAALDFYHSLGGFFNLMQLLIPNECHYCGLVDEAKFVYAGPHVKQICNGCGKYVKFFDKSKIPDARETKLAIWAITTDLAQINEAKQESGFVENLKGLDLKMIYWRLYLEIRRRNGI